MSYTTCSYTTCFKQDNYCYTLKAKTGFEYLDSFRWTENLIAFQDG
jgi:hypothetical protein